ncbi:MAG TPA: hypothetical protein VK470_07430 [Bacteroidota bacterium]|nr:hypothetical protein [Bacteroidota bacterium]
MAAKKKSEIEYRLLVVPAYDETLQKFGTLFLVETVKQFTNFNYQILIEESFQRRTVTWKIHGLSAPAMSMPAVGGAKYHKIYFDLNGTVHFTIFKKDGQENTATLKVTPAGVKVVQLPEHPFMTVYTGTDEFEAKRIADMQKPSHKPDIHRSAPVQK